MSIQTTKKSIFIALILASICSCENQQEMLGSFPTVPVNFEEINSEFDDYNSTSPTTGETFPLCFSSNRKSSGSNFDVVYKLIDIRFTKRTGKLEIGEFHSDNLLDVFVSNTNIFDALNKTNTSNYDELGPYLFFKNYNFGNNTYIYMYSNNSSGNQDIKFTQNEDNEYYAEPIEVSFLNSSADDAYPALNRDNSEIYFTSNRDGNFDIYRASIDISRDLVDALTDSTQVNILKDTILSSTADDKCSFITDDFLVFTSNRSGGFGGYDLYYSRFVNGKWSVPQNFGNKINTEYDEYRPIVRQQFEFANDFMLFSSNRPGGKGGFDLYYVGIENITKNFIE